MGLSLKFVDGDLSIASGKLQTVSGLDKLKQDLSLWLIERWQDDRFHLNYGSILDNFIGGVIQSDTQVRVQSEVLRVLQNYQQLQIQRFRENPGRFTPDELLQSVQKVSAIIQFDSVIVVIEFTTASGTSSNTFLKIGV